MAKAKPARFAAAALFICLAVAIGFVGSIAPARAAASAWVENDHARLRLVSATNSLTPGTEVPFGLHFQLQPGWKIYWRTPGDAGFPPIPEWSRSENVASLQMEWPTPERFSVLGLETLGYESEVVLPITVRRSDEAGGVKVDGVIRYLTCNDICVPYEAEVALAVPPGAGDLSEEAHLINRFASQVPGPAIAGDLELLSVSLTPRDENVVVSVRARSSEGLAAPDLFVEGPAGTFFGAPDVSLSDGGRVATLTVVGGGVESDVLTAEPLTLTLRDGSRALETSRFAHLESNGAVVDAGLLLILGFALLGGLILNLMPCVLPVLSLKLMSAVKYGGKQAGEVRVGFLTSAAGILTAFLILAVALIALKGAGMAVGWGIQFQQPVFLAAMVMVLTLFASNLAGLFEVRLPGFLSDAAVAGSEGHGLAGHFLTGMFATLLATPCSAPFLGTAVGFALAAGPAEILAVFAALGVGLSIPYLFVAAVPRLATALPKPGPWMVKLRWILAVALALTALWLISVLLRQAGVQTAVSVTALALLVAAVLATRKLSGSRIGRHAGKIAALLCIAIVAAPFATATDQRSVIAPLDDSVWERFDAQAIDGLVSSGRLVFVDVTADWCITCQFNKTRVLGAGEVAVVLARPDVVAMKADWTSPDPSIADYLARYGRYGIPFNIVYGPGSPGGIPLPELLTNDAVMSALQQAAGDTRFAFR